MVEELEIVEIISRDPTKVMKVETKLPQYKNKGLVKYLKEIKMCLYGAMKTCLGLTKQSSNTS